MTLSDLADSELVAAMASLRAAHPELDEYIRRQDARVARQREVTRQVLDVVASPAVAVIDLEATCYGTPKVCPLHREEDAVFDQFQRRQRFQLDIGHVGTFI